MNHTNNLQECRHSPCLTVFTSPAVFSDHMTDRRLWGMCFKYLTFWICMAWIILYFDYLNMSNEYRIFICLNNCLKTCFLNVKTWKAIFLFHSVLQRKYFRWPCFQSVIVQCYEFKGVHFHKQMQNIFHTSILCIDCAWLHCSVITITCEHVILQSLREPGSA